MMSFEAGLLKLYEQKFEGAPLAESGGGAGEEARLRSTPVGVYEFSFRQLPRYEFGGALFFNGADPDGRGGQRQLECTEDITGGERTLTIRSASADIPIESVEVVPLNWRQDPLDFTQLDVGASHRTIRYADNPPPEALRVRISGLNVFDVESVTACLWAGGSEAIRFHEPQAAFVRRLEVIRVDALDNLRGEARGLEAHLRALLGILLDMLGGRGWELHCYYQHQLTDGGPEVSVPVLAADLDASEGGGEIASGLASQIKLWHRDVSPVGGAFAFGVRVHSLRAPQPFPVLLLSNLLLPSESIPDLE